MNFRIIVCIIPVYLLFTSVALSQRDNLVRQIDHYLQKRLATDNIPGLAIAVVHGDSIIMTKGYGNTGDGTAVTENTPFAVASLSKGFTAVAILQLVESGKINLDDPFTKYIPEFNASDPRFRLITVRQLLNQTSGMSDKGFSEFTLRDQPLMSAEAIARMNSATLTSEPGEAYHYHNPNYNLLARIVEKVSGETFAIYVGRQIAKPLDMVSTTSVANTSLFYSDSKLSKGHVYVFGKPVAMNEPAWSVDGAAGIVTTASDMARWLQMHLRDSSLLNKKSLKEMRNPALRSYAMGWFVRDSALYHSGVFWTYSAEEIVLTENNYGVVLMVNSGINAYHDYNSYLNDIVNIINGETVAPDETPFWLWPLFTAIVLLVMCALPVRALIRTNAWLAQRGSKTKLRLVVSQLWRLIPLILVMSLPLLVTALSGRVLSAYRVFLMAPDIVGGLWLIGMLNVCVLLYRVFHKSQVRKSIN